MIKNKGFTLVEMIVAVGLFAIVMVVATGAIFSIVGANRSAQSLNSAITNFSFAAESMVREIRTGHGYVCGQSTVPYSNTPTDCATNSTLDNSAIAFTNADNIQVSYFLDSGTHQIMKWVNGTPSAIAITAPEVVIQSMDFYVVGAADSLPKIQPKVLLVIKGYSGVGKSQSGFNIQTLISQRLLNTQ